MSIADVIAYSMLHCVFPLARDAALQKGNLSPLTPVMHFLSPVIFIA